jgi:flavin-dependent dehydrogenase
MEKCDVVIVGGGPAGSTCAWNLRRAGLDVAVLDKAAFPRDKLCAGWVTPAVLALLEIDPGEYGRGRVCQPITGFRVGKIGGPAVAVDYGRPVSYGIRRIEFDHYLLERCGARLRLGEAVRGLERTGRHWVIDGRFSAPMLVAAGGHFCPVARRLGGEVRAPVVAAQEIEFPLDTRQRSACRVEPEIPELYFCSDLAGYGWCFRKGGFLNVGLGREDGDGLSGQTAAFCEWLKQEGRIPHDAPAKFHGHAYYLYRHSPRKLLDDGLLAVGDAAGLASEQSGEGIRVAVESGELAARVIAAAGGDYRPARLAPYEEAITAALGARQRFGGIQIVPGAIRRFLGGKLLESRWFVRHVVLDRWFLHRDLDRIIPANGREPPARGCCPTDGGPGTGSGPPA